MSKKLLLIINVGATIGISLLSYVKGRCDVRNEINQQLKEVRANAIKLLNEVKAKQDLIK